MFSRLVAATALALSSPVSADNTIEDMDDMGGFSLEQIETVPTFEIALNESEEYQNSTLRFAGSSQSCSSDGFLVEHFYAVGLDLGENEEDSTLDFPEYREGEDPTITDARMNHQIHEYTERLRTARALISTSNLTLGTYGRVLQIHSLTDTRFGMSLDEEESKFSNAFSDFIIASGYSEHVEALTSRPVDRIITLTGSRYEPSEVCEAVSEEINRRTLIGFQPVTA